MFTFGYFMEKVFPSHFIDEKIDAANYITEFLIKRFAIKNNISIPSYPFWRKKYRDKNVAQLDKLAERYNKEIISVSRLLKVFAPAVVLEYLKETTWYSLFYLTSDFQKDIIFNLYKKQVKYSESKSKDVVEKDASPYEEEPELPKFTGTSMGTVKKGIFDL